MKERNLKALLVLLIFFLMDAAKPFAYSLITEFTFLGVILICLNYPLKISFLFSAAFGYLKDVICNDNTNFSLLEFSIIAVLIHYFMRNFHGKAAKILIFLGALLAHIIVNSFHINRAAYFFSFLFFMQSSIIFLLVNRLFRQWLYNEPKNNNVF